MTTPAPASKPYWNGSRIGPFCPCGERLGAEMRPQGEMQHSYYACAGGHKWCQQQVGWDQWEWVPVF